MDDSGLHFRSLSSFVSHVDYASSCHYFIHISWFYLAVSLSVIGLPADQPVPLSCITAMPSYTSKPNTLLLRASAACSVVTPLLGWKVCRRVRWSMHVKC